MGVLNNTAETFDISVRDIAELVDTWIFLDVKENSYDTTARRTKLQTVLRDRIVNEILNIPSPAPTSIQIRNAIYNVLQCRTSVRKKKWYFSKGHKLAYFYDVKLASHMHRGYPHEVPRVVIPKTIIYSTGIAFDCDVVLKEIASIHILLNQFAPEDHYRF